MPDEKQHQGARPVLREVVSARTLPRYRYAGGLLRPETDDVLLARGGGGLAVYRDLERDAQVAAVLAKRIDGVLAAEWDVEPASSSAQDKRAAELVKRQLENLGFDDLTDDLLDALLLGRAAAEVMWATDGSEIVAAEVRARDPELFAFDLDRQIRLLTAEAPTRGVPVPERKILHYSWGGKYGDPYGRGLGYYLYWPVYFKRNGLTYWLIFTEKFAGPTVAGEYDAGSPTAAQDRQTILDAAAAVHLESAIAVPRGLGLSFLEAARSGSIDSYEKLVAYMDKQITLATLGVTLTTDLGGQGARAAAETHQDEQQARSKRDAAQLCDYLNRTLVAWITHFNFGETAAPPRLVRHFPDQEDLGALSERDQRAYVAGFRRTLENHQEIYGGEWQETPGGFRLPGAEFAEASEAEADPPAAFAARLAEEAAPAVEALAGAVRAVLDDCQSLEEFSERIIEAFPAMRPEALARLVERALTAARLAGHHEVELEREEG